MQSIVLHLCSHYEDECKWLDGAIPHGALMYCGPGLPDDLCLKTTFCLTYCAKRILKAQRTFPNYVMT